MSRRASRILLAFSVLEVWGGLARADWQEVSPDGRGASLPVLWSDPRPLSAALADPGGLAAAQRAGSLVFLSTNDDPEGDMPREVAYTRDGGSVVIVNRDTDLVTFLNVDTRQVTDSVPVGDYPLDVAVTPDNAYAVVPNALSDTVSIIDVATRSVVADVAITGSQPCAVAISPDSQYAVVGVINDAVSSTFSVIDLNTLSEVSSFPSAPQGVIGFFFTPESGISGELLTQFALSPDGTTIVQPDRGGSRVVLFDRASASQIASLTTSTLPTAVDLSADGTLAVVSHESSPGAVTTIDLVAHGVIASYSTTPDGLQSQVVRLTPDKSHALAAISNNVIFVNLSTGARAATISTGVVGDIELSYDGQYAFVSNFNSSVINVATRTLAKTLTLAACVDAAASPTELRAVALNNRFREDAQFYNINGASGLAEGLNLSGAAPEGDASRDLAISSDGTVGVVCNNTSRNVCMLDLVTNTVRSYVDVGERPLDVAITPDGAYAVVCAADADKVVIIDLATDTVVKNLSVFSRPARVRISPDSQTAYVLNVAGTDQISFIHLAGAASSIVAQRSAGQTGSAQGYPYTEISGIELSADGGTLAVCDSFNDLLRLFDTASMTQVAAVPVGDFPIRSAFSPDGTRAYVSNAFSDNVSVVSVAGAGSALITNVGTVDFPLSVDVDPAGAFVYVGNCGTSPGIRVLNTATNTFVKTVLFTNSMPRDAFLSPTDGVLYAIGYPASTEAELVRIAATGATASILSETPLTSGPSDMVFNNFRGLALAAQPIPDGVDALLFGCPEDLNADRFIDLDDLSILLVNFGQSGQTAADGDLNGDTAIDLTDLSMMLVKFGQGC